MHDRWTGIGIYAWVLLIALGLGGCQAPHPPREHGRTEDRGPGRAWTIGVTGRPQDGSTAEPGRRHGESAPQAAPAKETAPRWADVPAEARSSTPPPPPATRPPAAQPRAAAPADPQPSPPTVPPPADAPAPPAKPLGGRFVYAGVPAGRPELRILENLAFLIGYDEDRRNPAWVAYRLPGEVRFTEHTRPSRFRADDRTEARVRHEDYTNSGFDRGHMAPSYAIYSRFGKEAQLETFLMSNICPQTPNLNRGRWGQLESRISGHRPDAPSWSKDNKEVWIVLGPIYAEARTPLPSRVAVPSHCFMIVLDEDEETAALRALAFMMPNAEQVDGNLEDYLTSIDEIELHTGLDFFWELEDPIETVLEMETAEQLWPVSSN
ncbi:MAG: DNA/RNA non-specific endonuclease [Phycisphaerae bacterium]|nr:DNA/RNA non-specific endonuclease [Phycisphaerae bacterium]